jgi:protein-S-isoprenylcysteine O-methyltransferase Ste14
MAAAALVLYGISLTITFGVRVALQLRRTGSTGLHGLPAGAGPWEWGAGGLFIAGLLMGGAAPILALRGILEPIPALDGPVGHIVGLVLAVGGIALTFSAQLAMGDSWRVGVDPEERTELVTGGPFRLVRNPIYSAMLPTVLGLVLMVPSALALAALVTLFIGLELQVRRVEEPYLLQAHGESYAAYAARVGRFVPRLGLLHGVRLVAIVTLSAGLALALFVPRAATALDSDLKGLAVFRLEASNGYSILGFAGSERLDGRGSIGLIVARKGAAVSYSAPATVTPTRLEADSARWGGSPPRSSRAAGRRRCARTAAGTRCTGSNGTSTAARSNSTARRAMPTQSRLGCPKTQSSCSMSSVPAWAAKKRLALACRARGCTLSSSKAIVTCRSS